MNHTTNRLAACLLCLLLPAWATAADAAAARTPVPASAPAEPRFDVFEFEIEGNSVLPAGAIEQAVYPFLGPDRSNADIQQAKAALEQVYRQAGYQTVSVDIPEQRADSGVIRLQVNEATLGQVRVTGSRYHDQERMLAEAPSLAKGEVPYFPGVQRDIQRLNRGPGLRVSPILRAGRTPGTTDVDLAVEDRSPLSGSLGLNNHASPNTSQLRLAAGLRYDNLFQRGHSLSLQYQTTPEKPSETKALSLSYVLPLSAATRYLALYAVRSRSNVAVLGNLTTLGDGDIVGARLIQPLPGRDTYSHSLTLGADYKNFKENVVQAGTPALQTPIRYWQALANYSGTLEDTDGNWQGSLGLALGLRGAGMNDLAFDDKRFGATGNFAVLKWDLQRTQKLASWLGLVGRIEGQFADQPLVSNEQISAGGVGSVRGYLQSETLGDNGLRGSIELSGPSLLKTGLVTELRPYAFVDASHLRVIDGLPGQKTRFTLASRGLGLTLRVVKGLTVALNVAWPVHDTSYTRRDDPRAQVDMQVEM